MYGDDQRSDMKLSVLFRCSKVGESINELERLISEKVGCKYAVVLSFGKVMHYLAVKPCREKLYG